MTLNVARVAFLHRGAEIRCAVDCVDDVLPSFRNYREALVALSSNAVDRCIASSWNDFLEARCVALYAILRCLVELADFASQLRETRCCRVFTRGDDRSGRLIETFD